jgi:hypothetical protein
MLKHRRMRTLFALVIGAAIAGCGPSTTPIDMCSQTTASDGQACVAGCSPTTSGSCTCDATSGKWKCTGLDGGTK